MAKYVCMMCGYTYDEEVEKHTFEEVDDNWSCGTCGSPKSLFENESDESETTVADTPAGAMPRTGKTANPLAWPASLTRYDQGVMDEIHAMAENGKSVTQPMDTREQVAGFGDLLILGAQLATIPLADEAEVDLSTVIGKHADKPLVLESPVFVSHMSFGALSAEAKTALAMGASLAGTAMCSGEGGILPAEREAATRYIFEYVPNLYSVTDENLRNSDAIEIKIGQGTKPGMGGHLPGSKVTSEIAHIRNKPEGQDVLSPSHFPGIKTPTDMKKLVDGLRQRSGGRPIGIKLAAGHIERDLVFVIETGVDFVTIDGRGGATGSSPKFLKDHSSVPTVYALNRAVRYLREHAPELELIITGGLRTSGDVVKALALGADAVAMASAPLMACACQRYRVCHLGTCPMGIATQDPELRARLIVDQGAQRVANFLRTLNAEIRSFCRCMGHQAARLLSRDDLVTNSEEMAKYTGIPHVGQS